MSYATAAEEINRAFRDVWEAGSLADMPIRYDNHRFSQPTNSTWGALTIRPGRTTQISLGNAPLERTPFILYLQIFLPEETGSREAYRAADVVRGLNRACIRKDTVVLHFETASLEAVPSDQDGWEAFNVTIAGHFDTHPTAP